MVKGMYILLKLRCELGTDEFVGCTEVLENVVIVNENKESSRARTTSLNLNLK